MYWKLLGRAPDTEGRRHFANLMAEGSTQQWDLTAAQIADELLHSDEFAIRHELDPRAADPSSLQKLHKVQILKWCDSLEHFVLTERDIVYLYIKILGRFPDEEATRHYQNVVEHQDFTIV